MSTKSRNFTEICGAIHLHTTFSDGCIDFPELTAAARDVELDYVVVTDHMTLAGKDAGHEGRVGGRGHPLVVIGYEHEDDRKRNHYLVIGTESVVQGRERPQDYIDAARGAGGIGFIAHPMERRNYFKKLPPYPWTDWGVTGFDGIEVWNQTSDWVENLKSWRSFIRILFPRRFMSDAPQALLRKWDDLNRARFVAGIGGVDAHSRKFGFGLIGFTIFPIRVELKGIRTHLLLDRPLPDDNARESKKRLIEALRRGNGFISNFRRGDARGTRIVVRDNDGNTFPPGRGEKPLLPPAQLEVALPGPAEIRLLRNSEVLDKVHSTRAGFPLTEPGVYRIEARRNNRAWIYSNPVPIGAYPLD